MASLMNGLGQGEMKTRRIVSGLLSPLKRGFGPLASELGLASA